MKRSGSPKRRKPLDRGSSAPLSRSKGLERGEGSLGRGKPLEGGGELRRTRKPRPKEGPLTIEEWARTVAVAADGRSAYSGERVAGYWRSDGPDLKYFHHVVPKGFLRERGLYSRVWDPRNGILLTPGEHDEHERRRRPIPYDRLPASAIEFANELGDWAVAYLEKTYPSRRLR